MPTRLALKVDVDTDRGTREGVPHLVEVLRARNLPACFLFSLGPDQTGRAVTRIFRPGFLRKVSRTSVVGIYGVRTLLNGTLLPAPHIGRRNADVIRRTRDLCFEVGIHAYNHYRWQDHLCRMTAVEVDAEFAAARNEFRRILGSDARCAGAAGWQSNALSRDAYDRAALLYSSDTRGAGPFFPHVEGRIFRTLEIPTTLPTLDELMGRPEFPDARIADHVVSLLRVDRLNLLTIHAEIEGMGRRGLFAGLLERLTRAGVEFVRLEHVAGELLAHAAAIPVCAQVDASIDGRSGCVATQGRVA